MTTFTSPATPCWPSPTTTMPSWLELVADTPSLFTDAQWEDCECENLAVADMRRTTTAAGEAVLRIRFQHGAQWLLRLGGAEHRMLVDLLQSIADRDC